MDAQSQKGRGAKPRGPYGELRLYKRDGSREIDREALDKPDDYKAAFNRLFDRNPSATDSILQVVRSRSGLDEFPKTEWQRDLVVSDLQSYLAEELRASVSSRAYKQYLKHGLEIHSANSRRIVCKALDEIILQAAIEQGPNIFLLLVVQQRLTDWTLKEKNGSERWEALGKRFAWLAKVVRGKANVPLYPWWAVEKSRDTGVEGS
jgi:hypothetical protein